jgi:Arc/MetJ-type ribon-helix-helix transcriptional regulator
LEVIVTTTVKLPTALEMTLRQHCAVSGESISEVIRIALEAHLSSHVVEQAATAWSLGAEYFGRYAGPTDLSETFREARGSVWDDVAADKSTRRTRPTKSPR